jgi:hypothetical protein
MSSSSMREGGKETRTKLKYAQQVLGVAGFASAFGDLLADSGKWRLDNVWTGEYASILYDRAGTSCHTSRRMGPCFRYLPTICCSSAALPETTTSSPSRAARFASFDPLDIFLIPV